MRFCRYWFCKVKGERVNGKLNELLESYKIEVELLESLNSNNWGCFVIYLTIFYEIYFFKVLGDYVIFSVSLFVGFLIVFLIKFKCF